MLHRRTAPTYPPKQGQKRPKPTSRTFGQTEGALVPRRDVCAFHIAAAGATFVDLFAALRLRQLPRHALLLQTNSHSLFAIHDIPKALSRVANSAILKLNLAIFRSHQTLDMLKYLAFF